MKTRIAIIGGGAAGCFCAINIKRRNPEADVHILEGNQRALMKVAITGGGRCNLTNTFRAVRNLKDAYPRGDKLMRRALMVFSHEDCCRWFEQEGVRLVAQDDECIFPQSQDAMEIVHTLMHLIQQLGIRVHYNHKVSKVAEIPGDSKEQNTRFAITNRNGATSEWDKLVVTTGGHPSPSGFEMLRPLEVQIEPPVPSLFTMNVKGDWRQELMGTVVNGVSVCIAGTKFRASGPLLLTHWGMSGPAILKLSSYAARYLKEQGYRCRIAINWLGDLKEEEVRQILSQISHGNPHKLVTSAYPTQFISRHWALLLQRAAIPSTQRWNSLNTKQINRLVSTLTADIYEVTGRYPHKEEFVTCGGVSLKEIDISTMQSKRHPGLFFAGEVLDIDAITGGFNLQAAWSTAYAAAMNI